MPVAQGILRSVSVVNAVARFGSAGTRDGASGRPVWSEVSVRPVSALNVGGVAFRSVMTPAVGVRVWGRGSVLLGPSKRAESAESVVAVTNVPGRPAGTQTTAGANAVIVAGSSVAPKGIGAAAARLPSPRTADSLASVGLMASAFTKCEDPK